MSIYAVLPFLIVLAGRSVIRRYSRAYSYALWMLVFLRLLIPAMFESPYSIQPELSGLYAEERFPDSETERPEGSDPEQTLSPVLPKETAEEDASLYRGSDRSMRVRKLLEILYVIGAAVTAGSFCLQYVAIRRKTRLAVREEKGIWRCEGISSAFVMGLFRPRIYLPYGLEGMERRYVVQHEKMHIRHLDPWIGVLPLAALCLHWWNPLVWYSAYKMQEDMEIWCDEAVMDECAASERKLYSDVLLRLSARQSGFPGLCFGESHTERRIRNILKGRKKAFGWRVLPFYLLFNLCVQICYTVPAHAEPPVKLSDVVRDAKGVPASRHSVEEMPVELWEVILSDQTLRNGETTWSIQLVMTEGEYFTEEYAGSGGGTYEENFRGLYELRVWGEDGRLLSKCRLQDEAGGSVFNFGGSFSLELADYNADGCVDFTLGTWGSSSMGIYYLYTIREDGSVVPAYPGGIADIGFAFSRQLEQAGNGRGFVTYLYDNAEGTTSRVSYLWDEEQQRYQAGPETPLPEGSEEPAA